MRTLHLVYEIFVADAAVEPADDVLRRQYELAPVIRTDGTPLPLDQQIAQWLRRSEEYTVGIAAILFALIAAVTGLLVRIVAVRVAMPASLPWIAGSVVAIFVVWRRRRNIRQVAHRWTQRDVAARTSRSRPSA